MARGHRASGCPGFSNGGTSHSSARRPAGRSCASLVPSNRAWVRSSDVFDETGPLPTAYLKRFACSMLGVLFFCHCFESSLGQETTGPVRGLIYYAVEELDNNRIVLQGTAGSEGIAFDRLIL